MKQERGHVAACYATCSLCLDLTGPPVCRQGFTFLDGMREGGKETERETDRQTGRQAGRDTRRLSFSNIMCIELLVKVCNFNSPEK